MNEELDLMYKITNKYEVIDMDDNVILMPIKSNSKAIILNRTSKILLNELKSPLKLNDLTNTIINMFEVSSEKASNDVRMFIESMLKLSVIAIVT